MEKRFYDDVELMLVDPDQNVCGSIRHVLHDSGFRRITTGATWTDIRKRFDERMPDLLIADCMLNDGDFCELVHEMRHGEAGDNPFTPVIALTWDPTPETVRRVINSGADVLLGKPVSARQLIDRIRSLVNARKPFVVTSDYIGPDRLKPVERPADTPRFEVPNVLRTKMTGEPMAVGVQESIETINLEKIDRYIFQMGYLIERIVPAMIMGGPPDTETAGHLRRLSAVTADTARRVKRTRHEHVSDLCDSLVKVTGEILTGGAETGPKQVDLLAPLHQAIRAGFNNQPEIAARAREIAENIMKS